MDIVIYTLLILFVAYILRAMLGFGGALVAMPILSITLGLEVASPLIALLQATMTVFVFIQDRKHIEIGPIWRLVVASYVGIPLGVYMLQAVPEEIMRIVLGIFLIIVGGLNLSPYTVTFPDNHLTTYIVGFFNGILGGAYNLIGPLIVMYCSSKPWGPTKFRGMLQGYFLFINAFVLFNHYIQGMWTPVVFQNYWMGLPVIIVSFFIGNYIHHRIEAEQFKRIVNIFLVVMGVFMIYRAAVGMLA